jgi:hypothetical protein
MIPGWSSIPVNPGASFRGHMASGVSMATTGKTCFCVSTYTQHYYQEEKDADNSTSLQNWKLIHEDLVAAHVQCEGPEFRV